MCAPAGSLVDELQPLGHAESVSAASTPAVSPAKRGHCAPRAAPRHQERAGGISDAEVQACFNARRV